MTGPDRHCLFPDRTARTARAAFLSALLAADAAPASASILAEVLEKIAGMGRSPLAAVMLNASINEPVATVSQRRLSEGVRVIIGYDPQGVAIEETAGPSGLVVTPAMAQGMQSGLAAGLYPPGSALYSLPPAGQLSLYEADMQGNRLDAAMGATLAVVDGSITNIMQGVLLPDLAPVRALAADLGAGGPPALELGTISTTVLGAVNSGEIVGAIEVRTDEAGQSFTVDLERARIATGGSIAMTEAVAGNIAASAMEIRQIGGSAGVGAIAANLSANMGEVRGRVTTTVTNQSTTISSITATVIGAVNSGIVDTGRTATDNLER